jgi:hypothetical protein
MFGSGRRADPWSTPPVGHYDYRRIGFTLAAIAAFVAIAVGGYLLGASQEVDLGAAEQAAMTEGEQRGTATGTRDGFRSTFKPARERAYEIAYRTAFRKAYRREFEQADLPVPSRVPVSRP